MFARLPFMYNRYYPFGELGKSIRWLEKRASKGNPNAQLNAGMCHYYGIKIKEDRERGIEWIMKAVNQNNLCAMGLIYYLGLGKNKINYDKAFKYFMESYSKERDIWAMYLLGKCYFYGQGVTKDIKVGMEWLLKAAAFKCPLAMNEIGYCYDAGIGVRKNKNEAFKWYMKGTKGKYSYSFFQVGLCYEEGKGVAEDVRKAIKFYKKAEDMGVLLAIYSLKNLSKECDNK